MNRGYLIDFLYEQLCKAEKKISKIKHAEIEKLKNDFKEYKQLQKEKDYECYKISDEGKSRLQYILNQ
ncbi:hypothetical protein ACYSNQ_05150 [Enterococcus sp. LJL51]